MLLLSLVLHRSMLRRSGTQECEKSVRVACKSSQRERARTCVGVGERDRECALDCFERDAHFVFRELQMYHVRKYNLNL